MEKLKAEGMSQWVKCLLPKHEDLISDPALTLGGRDRKILGIYAAAFNKRILSQQRQCREMRKTPDANLYPLHVHRHTHINTPHRQKTRLGPSNKLKLACFKKSISFIV